MLHHQLELDAHGALGRTLLAAPGATAQAYRQCRHYGCFPQPNWAMQHAH